MNLDNGIGHSGCKFINTSATVIGIMGGDIIKSSPKPCGTFYLETKGEDPYFIKDYQKFNSMKRTGSDSSIISN